MPRQSHRLSANTGLLDARGTAQILCSLAARYSAVEFADLCTIGEEIVLRDQILIVGKLHMLSKPQRLALQPLFDARVFVYLNEAFLTPELATDPRQLSATNVVIERGLTTATVEDATREARRLLGGEAHFGVPATPLLRQLQHWGLVQRPCIENTVWDLGAQYQKLSGVALDVRRRIQSLAALPQISIPPIALRAIQRSKTFEGIVPELLQLRREFSPLREHLRQIEERFRNGRLSPREALDLETAWRERWERLAEKLGSSTSRMALARTSLPLLKDGIKIVKGAVTQDAMDVVAATINWIGPGFEALGALQVRPVHRSVSNYLATTDQELVRAVAGIFETDFVRLDADMRALAYQSGNPWRLALDSMYRPSAPAPVQIPSPRDIISARELRHADGPAGLGRSTGPIYQVRRPPQK